MISDWLTESGRKAIEKMGWPTWMRKTPGRPGGDEQQCWLGLDRRGWFTGGGGEGRAIEEYITLALLRDHAREWLLAHNAWVPSGTMLDYLNYDAALIVAILATEPK